MPRKCMEHLLNIEFPWCTEDLPNTEPVAGPPRLVTGEMVAEPMATMKQGKAPGPSGVVSEILKPSAEVNCPFLCNLANAIITEKNILDDWSESYIINLYKGKGDAMDRGNHGALKLTEHCPKVIEWWIK